ncbi:interleukin-1 receptor type 2 [Alosa alosa]|uniref:interleukin-1 receptor type 2 n=1 Tax=Alosa alosa TaxID=278164 RepID=UPI0020152A5D|nr:interleukin-1 receptor type 2 [Alosa alosa]
METKSKHPTPLPRIWGPCCERCAGLAHADDVTDGDRVQLTYRGRSFSVMLVCVRVSLLDHGSVRVATETTEDMRGIFKGMFVKELAPAKRQVENGVNSSPGSVGPVGPLVLSVLSGPWFCRFCRAPGPVGPVGPLVLNETFCLKSNMSLAIYPSGRADMEMMSYLLAPVMPGNDGIIPCPIDDFNRTGSPLWYKDKSRAVLPIGRGRYHSQLGEILIIKHFSASDSGFYTCRVTVSVFSTLYNISRVSRVHTTGEAAPTFPPATISASTHTPETEDGYPRIIFPTNNSVFESHFGSSLVLRCTVVTGNRLTASTQVTWLVDGQSPSDLTPRVFQRELRLTGGQLEAELVILEVREEESRAEFRCVTQNSAGSQEVYVQLQMADEGSVWLAAGLFCGGCFVCVLSVFLYHLWPRPSLKHRDYFLTRQDSVF